MKHNQNIPHEVPKKHSQQPNDSQKSQLPPSAKNPSDAPWKQPQADENNGKEKSKETKGFTTNPDNNKTKRPIAGDNTSRLL